METTYYPGQRLRLDDPNGPMVEVVSYDPDSGDIRIYYPAKDIGFLTTRARLWPYAQYATTYRTGRVAPVQLPD